MSTRPSSTPTARGRRTREAILCSAAELFHRQGVHATSVDDILDASKTGKGQFYHHFGSKEALVQAVLRDRADRFFELQAPMLDALDTWDGIRAWFDTIAASHDRRGCPGCPFGMLASELADLDPTLRQGLNDFFDRWRAHLSRGLSSMIARGSLRADADPEALSLFCLAAVQGGLLLAKTRKDVAPLRTSLDQLMKHLRSFEPSPATPDRP
jgi:AcrR family transcriptional regulator